jgi:hypothetical protein
MLASRMRNFRRTLSLLATVITLTGAQHLQAGDGLNDPFDGISLRGPVGDPGPLAEPGHTFHNHHLGLFNGYSWKDEKKRKEGYKVGLEYEYQFNEWFGVRGFVDYESGDLKEWLYGAGLALHCPKIPIVLFVGGGAETKGSHSSALLRLSAEYQIPMGDTFYLAPTGGYDFVDGSDGTWFAGIMLGMSF